MSMLLDLSRFRGGAEQVTRRFEPDAFGPEEDFRVAAPVGLEAEIRKDANKVRLVGRLTAELEADCSRCLEPFRIPIDAPLDLLFLPESDQVAADVKDLEVQDADTAVSFYKDDVLDVGAMIREQFYLALPMKPLCTEGCRGLCGQCGTNLNTGACDCAPEWEDPRLAPLKSLMKKES